MACAIRLLLIFGWLLCVDSSSYDRLTDWLLCVDSSSYDRLTDWLLCVDSSSYDMLTDNDQITTV